MLDWSDTAICLSVRKHGETSAIVRVFSRNHGVFSGIVKGVSGKSNRSVYQAGNILLAGWKARTAEQIGMFRAEILEAIAPHAMQRSAMLSALTSAATLTEMVLPERAPYTALYQDFQLLMLALKHDAAWESAYARYELSLLSASGFGLDLSACAATGCTEKLTYVSPKSGRAVSADAGAPYRDKLFSLPKFWLNRDGAARVPHQEILDSLAITDYFIHHWLLAPNGKKLPASRGRLVASLNLLESEYV